MFNGEQITITKLKAILLLAEWDMCLLLVSTTQIGAILGYAGPTLAFLEFARGVITLLFL